MTKLLVTGAAGHLGRLVIEALLERGQSVIATTRDPAKLVDLAKRGVEVRRADFDARASLDEAFAGADRVLLISTDTVDSPGRRVVQHRTAVDALVAAGVKHVVYTSMPNADKSLCLIAPDHAATEAALAATELDYTILRNSMYTEMLLMSLPGAVASGKLVDAKANAGMTYVTRADCARAAAGALIGASGRTIQDVTGPQAITGEGLAALTSEVAGRPVAYVSVSHAQVVAGLVQHGLPQPMAEVYASFDLAAAAGDMAKVTSAVTELGGKPATTVRSFLESHRAALG